MRTRKLWLSVCVVVLVSLCSSGAAASSNRPVVSETDSVLTAEDEAAVYDLVDHLQAEVERLMFRAAVADSFNQLRVASLTNYYEALISWDQAEKKRATTRLVVTLIACVLSMWIGGFVSH